jgi:hypothetical protein
MPTIIPIMKIVLNVKNVDIFLNVGQGLAYDVWDQSRQL